MPQPESWANPVVTRSRVVLEMGAALVSASDQPLRQAKVLLRRRVGVDEWPLVLFGSATIEGVWAVTAREATLAMINPSAALTLAYRGAAPFDDPQPVRTLAVIPSHDQCVFVVHPQTGLRSVEDIARTRYPLRVRTRGTRDHSLAFMIGDITKAAGFTLDELRSWGGDVLLDGDFPQADGPEMQALLRGDVDAMFEEGLDEWLTTALDAGMLALPLGTAAIERLETLGYRSAIVSKSLYPKLAEDVKTIDFSGWPIFVHAETPDAVVRQLCAALEERKHLIPWQGDGPLPVEQMCLDRPATPIDVPFHPAAAAYWRERGYLNVRGE
jgi:TRAP-type uncharacterized transport system substrate-binding protein